MRRALTILLIPVFILTVTVGITLTSYSCKEIVGESMPKPCCKNVGKDGCCKKESVIIKVQDVFIKAGNNSTLTASLYFIREKNPEITFASAFKNPSSAKSQWDNAPPVTHAGFYILYGSLII